MFILFYFAYDVKYIHKNKGVVFLAPLFDYFHFYNLWQNFLEQNKDTDILLVNFEDLKKVCLELLCTVDFL